MSDKMFVAFASLVVCLVVVLSVGISISKCEDSYREACAEVSNESHLDITETGIFDKREFIHPKNAACQKVIGEDIYLCKSESDIYWYVKLIPATLMQKKLEHPFAKENPYE